MKLINTLIFTTLSALAVTQKMETTIHYHCKVPNTFALTIDDGPTPSFPELLDTLKKYKLVATFYVNSNNLLRDVDNKPLPEVVSYIKAAYDDGHEIGSHTYSHACFTETCKTNNPLMILMNTKEVFHEQIVNNENYIFNAIGKYPTSYRAPFGDGQTMGFENYTMIEWLNELGYYHVVHWDIETQDMENSLNGEEHAFNEAKKHYENAQIQQNSLISLQHAIPVTIQKIIPWVAETWLPAHPGMKSVTVSECLGLDSKDMYRDEIVKGQKINSTLLVDDDNSSPTKYHSVLSTFSLLIISVILFNIY